MNQCQFLPIKVQFAWIQGMCSRERRAAWSDCCRVDLKLKLHVVFTVYVFSHVAFDTLKVSVLLCHLCLRFFGRVFLFVLVACTQEARTSRSLRPVTKPLRSFHTCTVSLFHLRLHRFLCPLTHPAQALGSPETPLNRLSLLKCIMRQMARSIGNVGQRHFVGVNELSAFRHSEPIRGKLFCPRLIGMRVIVSPGSVLLADGCLPPCLSCYTILLSRLGLFYDHHSFQLLMGRCQREDWKGPLWIVFFVGWGGEWGGGANFHFHHDWDM